MKTIRTSRNPSKRWYTVVLLYPDYMTDDYGKDIYMAWAYAANVDEAAKIAQGKAVKAQADVNDPAELDPNDFAVVLAFNGKLNAVANALSFG